MSVQGAKYNRRKGRFHRALRAMNKNDPTFPHAAPTIRGFSKRAALGEAQNWRCAYCGVGCGGKPEDDHYPTIDEYVPIAAGGAPYWENQVMACRLCNTGRGAMRAMRYLRMVQTYGRNKAWKLGLQLWRSHRRSTAPPTGGAGSRSHSLQSSGHAP